MWYDPIEHFKQVEIEEAEERQAIRNELLELYDIAKDANFEEGQYLVQSMINTIDSNNVKLFKTMINEINSNNRAINKSSAPKNKEGGYLIL